MSDNNEHKAVLFSKLFGGNYYKTKGLPPHEIIDFLKDSNGDFYVFLPHDGKLKPKDKIRIREGQVGENEAKASLPSVKYMVLTKDGAREGNDIVFVIELAEQLPGDGTNLYYGDGKTNIKELWNKEAGIYATFKGSRIFKAKNPILQTEFPGKSRLTTQKTKGVKKGNQKSYPTIYKNHAHYCLIDNANDLETKIEKYIQDGVLEPYPLYDTKQYPINANSLEDLFKNMYKDVYGKNPPTPQTLPKPSTSPKPARSIREILSDIFKQITTIDDRRTKQPHLTIDDEAVVRLAKKGTECLFDQLAEVLNVPPTYKLDWSAGSGDALKSFYVLFSPLSAPPQFSTTGTYVAICFGNSNKPGVVAGIACGNKAKQTNPLELRKKTKFEVDVDVGNYNNSFLKGKVREWTPNQLNTDEDVQEFTQWIQTSLNDWFEMTGKPFLVKPFLMMNLLEDNLQVILTGAPGTGKTYTAKQVAAAFVDESLDEQLLRGDADLTDDDKENVLKRYFSNPEKYFPDSKELGSKSDQFKQAVFTDSVQFHPGYDYSDFVIGMKPVLLSKNGKELVMKEGRYIVADTGNEPDPEDLAETKVSFRWKDGIFKKFAKRAKDAYEKAEDKEKAPRFVFLIDEINRADLSRVFGELFSLLEEEYRYPNGKGTDSILLPNGERFSIPKNLFIIGTMNDIDRSVESMDFALRRRFAWKEVKASDTAEDILVKAKNEDGAPRIEPTIAQKLIIAMSELNDGISGKRDLEYPKESSHQPNPEKDPNQGGAETKTEDKTEKRKINLGSILGTAYELGAAYFAKFEKYRKQTEDDAKAMEMLWNNHIKGILAEYLRGRKDRDDLLIGLRNVFDKAVK